MCVLIIGIITHQIFNSTLFPHHTQFKVVLLGSSGAGKTSIFRRFIDENYVEQQQSTVQAACATRDIHVNNKIVSLIVWDTAGQEKFQSIASVYYRNATIGIIVFDVADQSTFQAVDKWIEKISMANNNQTLLYLVGSKCDLVDRQVSKQVAESYAQQKKMKYFETSARQGSGIKELFNDAALQSLSVKERPNKSEQIINVETKNKTGQGCC